VLVLRHWGTLGATREQEREKITIWVVTMAQMKVPNDTAADEVCIICSSPHDADKDKNAYVIHAT
jgi:hypothetical protein